MLLVLASACSPPAQPPVLPTAPPRADPSASGPAVDLARTLYPSLANAATAAARGDTRTALDGVAAAAATCRSAALALSAGNAGPGPEARRTRRVEAACQLLTQPAPDASTAGQALSLLDLALLPDGSPLPPAPRP